MGQYYEYTLVLNIDGGKPINSVRDDIRTLAGTDGLRKASGGLSFGSQ